MKTEFNWLAVALVISSFPPCWGAPTGRQDVRARVNAGRIEISQDNANWRERPLATRTFIRDIAYGRGLFVAVGGSYVAEPGVIVTSHDGIKWTRRYAASKANLYSITFGNGLFVAVGDDGTIITSSDGRKWQQQQTRVRVLLSAVAFGKGVFVAGGESGTILVSTNGMDWTEKPLGDDGYVSAIHYHDDLFMMQCGERSWVSRDGSGWREPAPVITMVPAGYGRLED